MAPVMNDAPYGSPSRGSTGEDGEPTVLGPVPGGFVPTDAAALNPHAALDAGRIEESPTRYLHVGECSRGGMGRVLIVHDRKIGRDVALKELLPLSGEDPYATPVRQSMTMVARFLREAQLTGQLEHPGIVPVYELDRRPDGTLYYTMKLVRGKTLGDALAQKKTLGERLELLPHVMDLCHAMAYAHSRGVIHRDIKPQNVMVGEFGETVVIDWGLAKARCEDDAASSETRKASSLKDPAKDSSADQTVDGTVLGTAAYMPPEQAAGDLMHVDERSDVYSLGAVLYEVLTGRPPFVGAGALEVLGKVMEERPAPVLRLERWVAPELAAICERAMARDPGERHASAKELADDLQAFISGQVFTEREARHSFITAFYAFGVGLVAAGAGLLAYSGWDAIPRPARVSLLFAAVAALYFSCAALTTRRGRKLRRAEALMTLGTLLLGASIFLTARIYALDALARHSVGCLAVAAIAAAYAARSRPNAAIAMLAGYAWFLQRTQQVTPASLWWFPLLGAAALLPFAYTHDSRTVFVGALLLIGGSGVHVAFDNGTFLRVCLGVTAFSALFFPWGLLLRASERRRGFAGPAITLATTSLAATLLPLGSMKAPQYLAIELMPGQGLDALQLVPLGLACAAAAVMWSLAAARGLVCPELRVLTIAFLASVALLLAALALSFTSPQVSGGETPTPGFVAFALITAATVILGTATAWTGVVLLDRTVFFLGTLLNVLVTLHCAVEINANLPTKSMIMMAAGLIVILTGGRFESFLRRRKTV